LSGGKGPERVRAANAHIEEGAPLLWSVALEMINSGVDQGFFKPVEAAARN